MNLLVILKFYIHVSITLTIDHIWKSFYEHKPVLSMMFNKFISHKFKSSLAFESNIFSKYYQLRVTTMRLDIFLECFLADLNMTLIP